MITARRRLPALLAAGALALLATSCASSLGYDTPCSVWVSMDNADQRGTVTNLFQQEGEQNFSASDISQFQRRASEYCSDPVVNQPTIVGMLDSRAS